MKLPYEPRTAVLRNRSTRVAREHLLTAKQMAQFCVDGYLMFDGFVPKESNDAGLRRAARLRPLGQGAGNP